jgi:hypothetical protein
LVKSETAVIVGEPLVVFPVKLANTCSSISLLNPQKPLLLPVPFRYTPVWSEADTHDPPNVVPVMVMAPVENAIQPSESTPMVPTPAVYKVPLYVKLNGKVYPAYVSSSQKVGTISEGVGDVVEFDALYVCKDWDQTYPVETSCAFVIAGYIIQATTSKQLHLYLLATDLVNKVARSFKAVFIIIQILDY